MNQPTQLYSFVRALFEGQGKELSDGAISIEMDGIPRFLVIRLYEDKDKKTVEVTINRDKMGIFREYTKQGYKYEFEQRYRKGLRNGKTSAEQFMEDTCTFYRDTIHLLKAYS